MDEISKIGNINSVNDFFDFKVSIKTIILCLFAWGFAALVVVIFLFGGLNNTLMYVSTMLSSIKTMIVNIKNKNTEKNTAKPIEKKVVKQNDETIDKNIDENTNA